jgi:hemolysin activation/secretion protein
MNAAFNAPPRVAGLVVCCLLVGLFTQVPVWANNAPVAAAPASSADPAKGAVPPAVAAPAASASTVQAARTAAAQAPAVRLFDVDEVQVEGNTVLPVPTIEHLLLPYAGPGKSLAEMEKARAELEKLYQQAGFVTVVVDLDTDAIAEGVLKLNVLEGKIERVKVTGAKYVSPAAVRRDVAELAEGSVPNFNVVQRQLMAANKGDERRVQPIIRPGLTPGTVETELQVADQLPLSLNVELNNRQTPDTRPLRLNATLRYDNLFQRNQSLAATVITSPQDTKQSKVGVLSYTIPTDSGATWALYAVRSDSRVEPLGASTVVGKGTIEGVRYVLPLPGLDALNHSLSLGVDYKHFRDRIGDSNTSPTTPLTYLPFSIGYNGDWVHEHGDDALSATYTWASRDFFQRNVDCPGYAQPVDQFACKNPHADGSFSTLKLDWRHTHALFGKWNGVARLAGQMSSQPLVANEQYQLGGLDTVRGYLEAEVSGDRGVLGSLELQSPNWMAGRNVSWLQELSTQLFVDGGRVYVSDPLADVPAQSSLLAAGMGFKLRTGKVMNADLSVAWPYKQASSYTQLHKPRWHARMVWQF